MTPSTAFPGIDRPARIIAACALGAGIDAAMAWRFGLTAALPAYGYLGAVAAVVTVTDLAARKIPEAVVLPSYPLAAALLATASAPHDQWWALARGGIAMALLGGFYLTLGLTFPRQFGSGDIELGALLGLYLGWLSWSALATGTLLAWLLAAVALPLRRVVTPGHRGALPTGPFLAVGALVAILLSARPH
jgi:leader peptidase (prepilin peptidase) / N-methyltransferase